jgi:lipopolysaccharide export system permease protein
MMNREKNTSITLGLKVLDRMIVKDLLLTFLAVLSVLVVIIVSRKFIKILAQAVEGDVSSETLLMILGFKTVIACGTFMPAAVFMAVLMVIGRMYRDQEISAIASAGGGVLVIYRAVLSAVIPLSLLAGGLSLLAMPWAEATVREVLHEEEQTADIRGISAGRFSEYSAGDVIFYTENIDADKRMEQVFVQHRSNDRIGIVNAQYGRLQYLPGGLYLVLENGERVQGFPGSKDFVIERFDEYAVRIEKKTKVLAQKREGLPTIELWHSKEVKDIAELQDRLAIPVGTLFMSFLAVPLAKLSPRGGVYGSLGAAFLIYFIYGNLQKVAHSSVASGHIPVMFGYIALPLFLIVLGGILLIRLYGIQWVLHQTGLKKIV